MLNEVKRLASVVSGGYVPTKTTDRDLLSKAIATWYWHPPVTEDGLIGTMLHKTWNTATTAAAAFVEDGRGRKVMPPAAARGIIQLKKRGSASSVDQHDDILNPPTPTSSSSPIGADRRKSGGLTGSGAHTDRGSAHSPHSPTPDHQGRGHGLNWNKESPIQSFSGPASSRARWSGDDIDAAQVHRGRPPKPEVDELPLVRFPLTVPCPFPLPPSISSFGGQTCLATSKLL